METIARLNGRKGAQAEAHMAGADFAATGDLTFARLEAIAHVRLALMGAVAVAENYRRTEWQDSTLPDVRSRHMMVKDCKRIVARCEADVRKYRAQLADLTGYAM